MVNTNRILKIFILIAGLTVVVLTSGRIFDRDIFYNPESIQNQTVVLTEQTAFFTEVCEDFSYFKHDTLTDCYYLYNSKNKLSCSVLLTMPYCKDIKGYGGCVPLAIVFHPNDKIRELVLLENSETKSYLNCLNNEKFFENWNGLTAKEAIKTNVDAVSGATYTSKAVIESCKQRLSLFTKTKADKSQMNWVNILGIVASFLFLIFAVYSFLMPQKASRFRIFLLIASVGILGFWQGNFLSLALFDKWLIGGVKVLPHIVLIIVLILTVLLPLITNKSFYCQFVCPFGAAQELVGKLNKRKITFSQNLRKLLTKIRFLFLFVIFVMLVVAVDFSLEDFEPFSAFNYKFASASTLIIALVVLFLSIFINKPWCRFFCPTGGLISLLYGKSNKSEGKKISVSLLLNIIFGLTILVLIYFNFVKPDNVNDVKTNNETIIMNNTLDVIHNRKSVRHFTDEPVTKEQLEIIVKAGMAAPSARNLQPWTFVVVTERQKLNDLADALPYAKMLLQAQAAIVVCGDMNKAATEVDSTYWVQDCSAATQNILLAVESLKLGAVWTATFPYLERMNPVIEILDLPDNIRPLNVIPIGVPTGEDKPKDKWKPENVHWEKW
ncbi:MAG: nitroreductase family protein [Bacteroidales bacterium]|nr:nitroreductase family protein [Bacteroidales bacterium]